MGKLYKEATMERPFTELKDVGRHFHKFYEQLVSLRCSVDAARKRPNWSNQDEVASEQKIDVLASEIFYLAWCAVCLRATTNEELNIKAEILLERVEDRGYDVKECLTESLCRDILAIHKQTTPENP